MVASGDAAAGVAGWPLVGWAGVGYQNIIFLIAPQCVYNGYTLHNTPVHWAATHGQLHTLMVLVENGADPFQKNLANESVCTDATRERHFHIVEWLDDSMQMDNVI